MKRIIISAMIVIIAIATLAVPVTAKEFLNDDTLYFNIHPTKEAVGKMVEVYELQEKMGFVKSGTRPLTVSFNADNGYLMLLAADKDYTITISGNSIHYMEATQIYAYYWSKEGWTYEQYGVKGTKFGVYRSHFYYSADPVEAKGDFTAFTGVNNGTNISFGSDELNATQILEYYQLLYSMVTQYEDNIEAVRQEGYELGKTDGKTECQSTHQTLQEQAYNEGLLDGNTEGFGKGYNAGLINGKAECEATHRDMVEQAMDDGYVSGYSQGKTDGIAIGNEAGYQSGQYDCQQTHEAMKREQYEEGWSEGHATGVNDGYDAGYDEGYETGYDEGYDAHAGAKEIELKKQYDDGYSAGKEVGYTEALNTGDEVIKYVDGLFSAPIDFLYGAFNIKILGVNLFNLFMLLLSILIVGGVLLLVFKFR